MKHAYLTQSAIQQAVAEHGITKFEAKKLMKKISCQAFIFRTTHI